MLKTPVRVLHMIAVLEMGGSQSMVMNIYRAIDRNKLQFDFIVDHPDRSSELRKEIESMGGRVYSFPTFKGANIVEIRKAWDRFFTDHPEYKILHTHSRSYASVYLPIAKKHGLVTISHAHSTSNGKGIVAFVKDAMQYPIRYQADYFFACSEEAGRWLFGDKAVQSERFKVIPNAIDAEKFKYDPEVRHRIRKELGIGNEFVVGHVGRLSPPKNHDFLLRCFAEFAAKSPDSKLLLVGEGELRPHLEKQAKELGIADKVLFLGAKTNTHEYYQAMDCFVFPSLYEGLGIAVVEAQAAGLPCGVSDTVPKRVDIGAGFVQFCSLNHLQGEWADNILMVNRNDRKSQVETMIASGYDIKVCACDLQTFYLSIK